MLQTLFPGERPVFQDDKAPVHTSRCVQTWLHEHDDEVEHLTWCPQSPDLNIIEPLKRWFVNLGTEKQLYFVVCQQPTSNPKCRSFTRGEGRNKKKLAIDPLGHGAVDSFL
ncbi:DDE_3 domain-containing protein [Trichonephila clavipes]|nr:DDE_3 domain-containing protein [Trichonephila clavipes]